jgi:putative ABC transport system permease protein
MGRIWRSLKLGLKSLILHKLRSSLTILGIVFGVAAVIAMLAIGEGSKRDAQERFQQLGATNIIYRSQKPTEENQASGGGGRMILNYGLKYADLDRLLATVPTIKKALPIREVRKEIRFLNRRIDGRVVGTTGDYAEFNYLKIARGRFLKESDNENFENYAVIASEVASTLFPFEDPLNRSVRIGTDYYKVIGVTNERAGTAAIGGSLAAQEYNKDVYIPLNTCRLRFGERIIENRSGSRSAEETQLTQITMQVGSIEEVRPSADVIKAAIHPFHTKKKDVDLVVPLQLIEEAERSARIWGLVLLAIASISLIVGGIGIMNIMLATVTERTREIGIRRALGAKRRDITEQFLIESVVLSGVGGVIGVLLGVGLPFIIDNLLHAMRTAITPSSIVLSFSISVAVGVLFGLYPARRAALMDPIDALRHE